MSPHFWGGKKFASHTTSATRFWSPYSGGGVGRAQLTKVFHNLCVVYGSAALSGYVARATHLLHFDAQEEPVFALLFAL